MGCRILRLDETPTPGTMQEQHARKIRRALRTIDQASDSIRGVLEEASQPPPRPPSTPPPRPRPAILPDDEDEGGQLPPAPVEPLPPEIVEEGEVDGTEGWAPPTIELRFKPRELPEVLHQFDQSEKSELEIDGVRFVCYRWGVEGIRAQCVTVVAINDQPNRGPAYFERFAPMIGTGTAAVEIDPVVGRHVLLPRWALTRRAFVGPEAKRLQSFADVGEDRTCPAWTAEQAAKELAYSRPTVGPFRFFWDVKNLDNSHGGGGVAPLHAGPEDWATCAEGRRLRSLEFLLEAQRPYWIPSSYPEGEPYWMGQTRKHRLEAYRYELDGSWCDYELELDEWRGHEHTHLWRQVAAAFTCAAWDPFARDLLRAVWKDFRLAHVLDRDAGDKANSNSLLLPLWKKIDNTDGPLSSGEGDRGLAHKLRFLRHLHGSGLVLRSELVPYMEAFRTWARRLADANGITYVKVTTQKVKDGVHPPWCDAFHFYLVLHEFQRFGGLESEAERLAEFLTPASPAAFEWEKEPAATAWERANVGYAVYEASGNMTHNQLLGDLDPVAWLAAMRSRGVNGSSQDLDRTPRHLWEPFV